jgi:hypothetical protein
MAMDRPKAHALIAANLAVTIVLFLLDVYWHAF